MLFENAHRINGHKGKYSTLIHNNSLLEQARANIEKWPGLGTPSLKVLPEHLDWPKHPTL